MRKTCLNMVHELARVDPRVVYIGSDPGAGTLDAMREEFPDRFLIEGISEANVIGMAAGLAMEGYVPYVNTIATFLTRRGLEQVAVDLCLQELPVRLIGNGGGLVYAPLGPTHTAVEDIALMRALPGMTVLVPTDAEQMRALMPLTLDYPGPIYIRLAKGGDPVVPRPDADFTIGRGQMLREAGEVLIIACGIMTGRALAVADLLDEQAITCAVLDMPTLKPVDRELLAEQVSDRSLVVSIEEHSIIGGLGSALLETLAGRAGIPMPPVLRLALPDRFTHNYGSQDGLLALYRLDVQGIAQSIREALSR